MPHQVGVSHAILIVEQEAMAPCIIGGLASEMGCLNLILRSQLLEKSQKQAQEELDSARVQAIE